MNNVSSVIIQTKLHFTCHSIHTATGFKTPAYTCYVIGMKTLLWHNYINFNGMCSSRREEAFATRVISGPCQKQIKRNYTSVSNLYHCLTMQVRLLYKLKHNLPVIQYICRRDFQMAAYTCYLVVVKTLVWHSCVDFNGICSSQR